jgi:hypothetical protein
MGLLASLTGLLSSCATSGEVGLSANVGDRIIQRLQVGMTSSEVDIAIGDLRKDLLTDGMMTISSESYLYDMYLDNYYPKDFLKTIEVGQTYRALSYWTNYAGSNQGALQLFFDKSTDRLLGWVNSSSAHSLDKFMYERLTSKLKIADSFGDLMTPEQVHALIGLPNRVIEAPKQLSRTLFEDHFWQSKFYLPPTSKDTKQFEVYEYDLKDDEKRRVYVAYTRADPGLIAFGYDHAWEEAERYLHEQEAQRKQVP